MRASSWCLLVGLSAAVACQRPGPGAPGSGATGEDPTAARAAINEANAQGVAAYNARDRAAVLAAYGENATVMHLTAPDEVGRVALDSHLGANWEAGRDSGTTVSWKADSIEVHGDFALEVGRGISVRPPSARGAAPDTTHTRYITFWRKEPDGRWRVSRDFTVAVPRPRP